jgi:hypothetical protein
MYYNIYGKAFLRDHNKAGLKNLQSSGSEWYVQISHSTWHPQLWMYTAGIGTIVKIVLSFRFLQI